MTWWEKRRGRRTDALCRRCGHHPAAVRLQRFSARQWEELSPPIRSMVRWRWQNQPLCSTCATLATEAVAPAIKRGELTVSVVAYQHVDE